VISQQLHNKVAESEARKRELQAQYENLMEAIQNARVAFGETVERELARTNQPEPTSPPRYRKWLRRGSQRQEGGNIPTTTAR
jgi:hypothetical protein